MKYLILLISILCIGYTEGFAQCCAAGNPSYMNNGATINKNGNLNIMVSYMYSLSNQYFEGSQKSNFKDIDNSYFNFTALKGRYNLTENLFVNANMGFFINKVQNFDFGKDEIYTNNAYGLADGSFGISYLLFDETDYYFNVLPSLNITLPIGVFDQKNGPVVLPIDIQPSSGSYRYNGGISFSKYLNDNDLFIMSNNSYEYSQRINTKKTDYKYGDLYNFSFSLAYLLNSSPFWGIELLSYGIEIRDQIRTKSVDKGIVLDNTGGNVLFISPNFALNFFSKFPFFLQFDFPVYKNMNGIQLTNEYALSLNLSYNIDFAKEKSFEPLKLENGDHKKKQFIVKGSCDMCKDRIEGIAKEFKNVILAEWDSELQLLFISFDEEPDFESILKSIAKAGHDAENYIADETSYKALPSCCHYK